MGTLRVFSSESAIVRENLFAYNPIDRVNGRLFRGNADYLLRYTTATGFMSVTDYQAGTATNGSISIYS
ncbi:hypothetical protein FAES_3536 [Fibrella aestuarina BUZ 2]|uniref:Uncharacterized protein n=1 Tax=Fibrella aestuarina BUZ 2 TaxID=1166018 RepID=I0KBP0_9BACT|nr:hypothetical protein FAES_3536 [Fibrella aestuarina BUZ 2]